MSTAQLTRRSAVADRRYEHHRHTRRMLNVPLLLGSLAAAAAVIPAVYFWHDYQTHRTAAALLDRAAHYEKDNNPESAAAYLHRFIQMHPGDGEVRVRLAKVYDRSAKDPSRKKRAVELYFQAIGFAPDDVTLRQRQAELLIEQAQFSGAEDQVKEGLKRKPQDSALLRLKAFAVYGQARNGGPVPMEQAVKCMQDALAKDPGSIELSVMLATVYREENLQLRAPEKQNLADTAMDRMIEAHPENPDAFLARARYRLRYNSAGAGTDIETALTLAPKNAYVLLAAADNAVRNHSQAAAEDYFRRALAADAARPEGYVGLADLCLARGQVDEALTVLRKGLSSADPRHVGLNVRLAEALITKGNFAEADFAIKAVQQASEGTFAQLGGAERQAVQGQLDYIRARWHLARHEYLQAIPLLRKAVVTRNGGAWLLLGQAYAALGQWDQAASAYEQAAQIHPKSAQVRARVAHARTMAENLDLAIHNYQQALALEDDPEIRLALARALFEQQLRLPAGEQDWTVVDKPLLLVREDAARGRAVADLWQIDLIDAGLAVMKGVGAEDESKRTEEAIERLRGIERQYLDRPAFVHDLAQFYDRLGFTEDADRACAAYGKLTNDPAAAAILKAKLEVGRRQFDAATKTLSTAAQGLEGPAKLRLESNLVDLELLQGKVDVARATLAEMSGRWPGNFAILDKLANLAIASQDFRDAEKWESQLRTVEGTTGVQWRYHQARRLAAEATDVKDARFVQAVGLHSQLETLRPGWSATSLLKGLLAERQGKPEIAIDAYQTAIRQGEQRVAVYERLIPLLHAQGRIGETEELLTRMQDFVPMSRELTGLAMSVAARGGKPEAGIEVARRAVSAKPNDPVAHLRLGQVLYATGKVDEAEASFLKACEAAPADPQTWSGLVSFCLATKRLEGLDGHLGRLEKESRVPARQRHFLLGQAYDRLGRGDDAAKHFKAVEENSQDQPAMLAAVGQFLLKSNPEQAEKLFRDVLRKDPQFASAKRALAGILAARGGDAEWKEAQTLLEGQNVAAADTQMNERFKAVLLAERGGSENRKQARGLLEQLIENSREAAVGDRLLLARLYHEDRMPQAAREQFLALVSGEKPAPAHVARYAEFLLDIGHAEEAGSWIVKLEAAAPQDWNSTALKARRLVALERSADAEFAIENYRKVAEGEPVETRIRVAAAAGDLYTKLGMNTQAEGCYRKLLELVPGRFEPLAKCLIRQDKVDEALELCVSQAKADGGPAGALALASVLGSVKGRKTGVRGLAEGVLEDLVKQHGSNADVTFALANLRVAQERPTEAIELYEKVVQLEPRHYVALNNLAFMLSEDPDRRGEALPFIERALRIAGPVPTLVDTKAMVLLAQGKPAQAIPLLERIVVTHSDDARFHLHLALAYRRMGSSEKAGQALQKMRDADLDNHVLTPEDKKLLAEIR